MKYYEASIFTNEPDELAGQLIMMDITSVRIEDPRVMEDIIESQNEYDWDYIDPKAMSPENGSPRVICYFEDKESCDEIAAKFPDLKVTIRECDDSEWKDKYKETFKTLDLTDSLMIKPSWEDTPDTDKHIIDLDPGMAFGTGDHETTSMCAVLLEEEGCAGKTVLDVGTGSGILSIAACYLGAKDVLAVDMGMLTRVPGTMDRHVGSGTADITEGPAMSREQAEKAVAAGIDMMKTLSEQGYRIAVIGEMGIGNTTAASAVTSVLLGLPPEEVTGRGAGLSDAGLRRKIAAIRRAVEVNRPDADDPMDVLAKLGGFELAGMAGAYLGGLKYHIPTIPDGMIPAASALLASRMNSEVTDTLLPGPVSKEPADRLILDSLGLEPVICAQTALGEGTGGILLLPLLDMALKVYNGPHTFEALKMEAYTPQEELP